MNTKETIQKAISAIGKEIEAVRETPSTDVLTNGIKEKKSGHHVYVFESNNQGLRFAEEVKARVEGEKEQIVDVIDLKDGKVWLEFSKDEGKMIPDVFLEWENDFVLRRTEEHLHTLEDKWKDIPQLELLLNPQDRFDVAGTQVTPKFDDLRNESQIDAIQKALNNNITFIWGPPGTGKTATIGYIIANFLRLGKRVLFVSNTNRAVDVGLLNVMDALYEIHPEFDLQNTTRFGDAWIDDERLETVLFEHQVKEKLDSRKSEAVELSQLLSQFEAIQDQVDELMENE